MRNVLIILYLSVITFLFPAQAFAQSSSMVVKKDGQIGLDNGSLKLFFADGKQFKMTSMSLNETAWLPADGVSGYPWQLTLRGTYGLNPQFRPNNGIYEGVSVKEDNADRATLVFQWKMLIFGEYYPVRMLVSIHKASDLSEWGIEMDVPEGWFVTNVNFPRITVKRTDASKLILPIGWGMDFGMGAYADMKSQYPSCTGAMQMMCLHNGDDKDALYFATHDSTASIKTFKATGGGSVVTLHTEIIPSKGWSPEKGGTFRMPWTTSVGLTAQGWEKTVNDWYRPFTYQTPWGSKSLKSRNIPQWMYDADLWIRPMGTEEPTLEGIKKCIGYFGKDIALHWYYWHQIDFDTNYPEYFPPKKGFVPMVREVQKLGAHIVPYTNGRLWDPATESYRRLHGEDCSARKEDGTLYTEIYGSKVLNTVTCPAAPVWQQVLIDMVNRLQSPEIGVNGVYLDQIAAGAGMPCWASNHGHAEGGGSFWHESYRSLLERMHKQLLPGVVLTSEENAECYIDLFENLLIVNTPVASGRMIPLFPMVYSDRVITHGILYNPSKLDGMDFRARNVLSLLWGSQLGWVKPEDIMAEANRKEAAFLKDLVQFRKKQHKLFYGGRLLKEVFPEGENPSLTIPGMGKSPAVRGALWQGSDGKKGLILINMDDQSHQVVLENGQTVNLSERQCIRIDNGF